MINVNQPVAVRRHLTAITRRRPSVPCRLAWARGDIVPGDTVLDYGCGRGMDVRWLRSVGCDADGFDPAYLPEPPPRPRYNVVMLNYVLNVIEDHEERESTLRHAWWFADRLLLVSVRMDCGHLPRGAMRYRDGYLTGRLTFQKFFAYKALDDLLTAAAGRTPEQLRRGIYVVRRDA